MRITRNVRFNERERRLGLYAPVVGSQGTRSPPIIRTLDAISIERPRSRRWRTEPKSGPISSTRPFPAVPTTIPYTHHRDMLASTHWGKKKKRSCSPLFFCPAFFASRLVISSPSLPSLPLSPMSVAMKVSCPSDTSRPLRRIVCHGINRPGFQAIRRSLKGEKEPKHHHHISITPKSAIAILPPKKVSSPQPQPPQ